MPKSKNVGTNIRNLKESHPEMKPKQRLAVALNEAREMGASIPKPRKRKK